MTASRPIARNPDGTYRLGLRVDERELLANLVSQLRDVLLLGTDDPAVRRLFPTGYNEDPERDREYQQLVRDELLERRLAALAVVEETLAAAQLSEEQVAAWLTALNDLRLVLGTTLDVSEDGAELEDLDHEDPSATAYALYDYLGYLVAMIVDGLDDALPPPSTEAG